MLLKLCEKSLFDWGQWHTFWDITKHLTDKLVFEEPLNGMILSLSQAADKHKIRQELAG